ncbi:MAG TPA: hypothetical protein VGO43_02045 [Pyrinomonadaceae bacterium]|jgi:hypothetical protein|nr:hypothetical protein [Pyrinomonadaceae bacterium]
MSTNSTLTAARVYYRFEEIDSDDPDPAEGFLEMAEQMPTLGSYEEPAFREPRFWRRQFGAEVTRAQRKFDWIAGFFLPLICFYFDPIVFRGGFSPRDILLGRYQIAAYFTGFVTTMALVTWLLWRDKLATAAVVPGGVLALATVISLLIGFAIFPYSVIGMIFGIGFLGLTPFLSAFVYGRNAVRALRSAGRVQG